MGAAARALVLLALLGAAFLVGVAPYFEAAPRTGISRDLYAYFFPRFVHVGRSVAAGVLPLWNPWELCGVPFLASGQTGTLNPLVALVFGVLPPGPALAVHLVLHLVLCGVLIYGLARALGLGAAGASVAGVVWVFSPALTHSLYHPNRIGGLVWMPVVFWLGLRAGERGGGRWAAPLGVALALQMCGGYPEFALDTAVLLGLALAAGLGAAGACDARRVARGLVWLAVAGAVGLLVAGLQLLPTLEMVGESAREVTAARPKLSPGPAALSTLFGLRSDVGLVYLGMVPAFYVGAAPLLLAVAGAVAGQREVRLPFVVGAVACVLAVVAFDWLHLLPFYRRTRFPLPWALLLPFFVAMLAGAGLEALLRPSRMLGLGVGAACVLVLLFGSATSRPFALVALVATALVARGRTTAGLATAAVVALTVAEAVVASPFRLGADPFPPLPQSATTQALLGAVRAAPEPVRFLGAQEAVRGVAMLEQVDAVTGLEESVMPRRLRRIVEHFGMNVGLPEMPLRLDAIARSRPLLDLLGVAYVTGPARWGAALEAAGMVPLRPATDADDGLWQNPTALPRAFLVRRARAVADADAAFAAVSAADFRPREEAILEHALDAQLRAEPGPSGESVRVLGRAAGSLVVVVEAASPALLVVTDTFYPGWTARVGEQRVEMHRVDFAFRGVLVPAGRHEVTFSYAPGAVSRGAVGSAIGLVLAAALWLLTPRARPA